MTRTAYCEIGVAERSTDLVKSVQTKRRRIIRMNEQSRSYEFVDFDIMHVRTANWKVLIAVEPDFRPSCHSTNSFLPDSGIYPSPVFSNFMVDLCHRYDRIIARFIILFHVSKLITKFYFLRLNFIISLKKLRSSFKD